MSAVDLSTALHAALGHLQNGQLQQAELLLRQILQYDPNQPDALHFLGFIAHQAGQPAAAAELMQRAVALNPTNPIPFSNLAESLRVLERYEEAEAACRRAVALNPEFGAAYLNLGMILSALHRYDEAIAALQRADQLSPDNALIHNSLGMAYQEAKRNDEARAAYARAMALNPNMANVHVNVGTMHIQDNLLDEAVKEFQLAIQLDPNSAVAHCNLSGALALVHRHQEAIAFGRKALEIDPSSFDSAANFGHVLQAAGRCDEAIPLLEKVLARKPRYVPVYNSLGNAYHRKGDFGKAIIYYEKALAIDPDPQHVKGNLGLAYYKNNQAPKAIALLEAALRLHPDDASSHFHLSMALLHMGDYAAGWEHYEWRFKCTEYLRFQRPSVEPAWEGQDPAGKRIVIHTEQGFGDAIQFIRYVPLLTRRGATVWLECQPELAPLLEKVEGVSRVFPRNDFKPVAPTSDYHCSMLSLPHWFHTDLTNIPATVPYLQVDPARAARWQERLAAVEGSITPAPPPAPLPPPPPPLPASVASPVPEIDAARKPAKRVRRVSPQARRLRRVGLSWAGSVYHADDRTRSCAIADFALLADIPGVVFYSLQFGATAEKIKSSLPPSMPVHDLMADVHDFADSAALYSKLDLVITVDTAPAHLAGALGMPVWTLLSYGGEWRWLRDRSDSPWYPTMRLFRQPKPGDWAAVFREVAEALRQWVATSS